MPGRMFGHAGGHFWRPGAHLGIRAGILALEHAFEHTGRHFGARLGTWAGILVPGHPFGHMGGRGFFVPGQEKSLKRKSTFFKFSQNTSWRLMF